MEAFSQVQNVVVEHAFTIGIGLLIAVVVAGIAWYWMSRGSSKSSVLENQARVNSVEMDIPSAAAAPEPHETQESNDDSQMDSQVDQ